MIEKMKTLAITLRKRAPFGEVSAHLNKKTDKTFDEILPKL